MFKNLATEVTENLMNILFYVCSVAVFKIVKREIQ